MPLYEYECHSCGCKFEYFVRPPAIVEQETVTCVSCSGHDVQRLVSGFAVASDNTKHRNLTRARKLGQKEANDRRHAEIESEAHHDD
jgi:putative FmdB family regulatory protein